MKRHGAHIVPVSRGFALATQMLVLALLFAMSMALAPKSAWAKTLLVGTISAKPVDEINTFQPFVDYLAQNLAADGIDAGEVVVASSIFEMAEMLKSGKADLFIDSSVTALAVNELSGAKYMLRRWKKGRGKYRSVVFVREDSPITTLEDLKNKVIAFEEPFSTSGYMLPAMSLQREGLDLVSVKASQSTPPKDKVGYVMGYDNETQAIWLERDRVQAVAMAEKDFKQFSKTALVALRALYYTREVPYHVVTHRADLEQSLVSRIKDVLKSAHESQEGRAILQDFERTEKFDEIPQDLLADVFALKPGLHIITEQQR